MRLHAFVLIVTSSALIACGTTSDAPGAPVTAAAARADIELPRDSRIVAARVTGGATLASLLRGCRLAEAEVAHVVARAASVFDLRKVRAAQPYRVEQAGDGVLRRFEYEIDGDRLLRVTRTPAGGDAVPFVAEVLPIAKMREVDVVRGAIDRRTPSLFAAMGAEGESVELSLSLADIFAGEIDFNTEVQPGDRFELLVEKQYRDDRQFAGDGPILAAQFDNAGRRFRAVRFVPPGGAPGYYDERGVSMRRFFLHSPLKFQPAISSGFSRSRLHPILREYRAHLGVDYKAPAGAPVIAAADGVVVEAGTSGGAGRMVHLRHSSGFESEYLHLSSIAVRAGMHVRQGDLLGRVGATGLATGPHLDYRVKKNGVFINPLTAHRLVPPADPIPAAHMSAFADVRERAFRELSSARRTRAAASLAASHPP